MVVFVEESIVNLFLDGLEAVPTNDIRASFAKINCRGKSSLSWFFEELLTTLVARTSTDDDSPNSPPFLFSNQRHVLLLKAVVASHSSSQMLRFHSCYLQFPVQQKRKFLVKL